MIEEDSPANNEELSLRREGLREKRTERPMPRHSPARCQTAGTTVVVVVEQQQRLLHEPPQKARHLQRKTIWLVPDFATKTQHSNVWREGTYDQGTAKVHCC